MPLTNGRRNKTTRNTTMPRVKNGRLFKVENGSRKFGANSHYIFTFLEDSDGENETPYLFTENQLKRARERAEINPEDLLKKDRLTDWFD
jgi:hypothetical protein